MCTELLPPGVNPVAVNKYIISYHILRIRTVIHLGVLCSYAAGNSQEPTDGLHFICCWIVHEIRSTKCVLFIHL